VVSGTPIGSPAALVNAVRDALTPLGVWVTSQPLTPDRILDLIEPVQQNDASIAREYAEEFSR
jgi:carbon-monoxide dehydrogenase large subunit